jgi:signal transduction histidine kinase
MNRFGSLWPSENPDVRLRFIQVFLPLCLFLLTLAYQIVEHLVVRQEAVFSPTFVSETLFFGVIGPVMVFFALGWFRVQWRQRAEAEAQVKQTYRELLAAQTELKRLHALRGELLRKLISAQEAERSRIAREIHDELGQLLTRLSLNLKLWEEGLVSDVQDMQRHLHQAQQLLQQTQEQAYHLIFELRPPALDELGLESALRDEVSQRVSPLGITASVVTRGQVGHVPEEMATAVFRIVQEAISNIIRHANARRVWVRLDCEPDSLEITIEDDGVGVAEDILGRDDGHRPLGLLGMQERAMAMDGKLRINARHPRGTRVHLWVPLPER